MFNKCKAFMALQDLKHTLLIINNLNKIKLVIFKAEEELMIHIICSNSKILITLDQVLVKKLIIL